MPKQRKTSTQPKRKVKKIVDKPKPVYPEYIQSFIEKVETITPLKVKVDQYYVGEFYSIGVLKKQGKVYRCIWMAGHVDKIEHLNEFWKSESFKSL